MKKIALNPGKFAIVDDDDYPYLSRFNWVLVNGHAAVQSRNGQCTYMEFFVKEKPKNVRYIFLNHDPLDLRKKNIEIVGWGASSAFHKKTKRKTTSKYKGVCWDSRSEKWLGYLTIRENGKRVKVLYQLFDNEIDAAHARDKKAREVFGNLTFQNFNP